MNEEPEFDASNPETHHQSKLMGFILSDKEATVQSLLGGDPSKPEFVRHYTSTITYDVYRLKGWEVKIDQDSYDKFVERMEKMEQTETKEGKKVYTKDDVKKFIRATCFNKCRAVKDEFATRDDLMVMTAFVEKLLFDQDLKVRDKPPKGITKSIMVSKSYHWDSKKFAVKCGVDAYISIESQVRKLKKKAKKEDAFNVVAETKKVVFLQKNMKLLSGEYCSGAEYAAYYKEIFKEMYPREFGSEKGLEKDADGIKPKDKAQKEITEKPTKKKKDTKKEKSK
jgi:hypothetical protein